MKSSRNESPSRWMRSLIGSFLEFPIRPSKVSDRIAKMRHDLLAALLVVVISGILITLGAFIAGGTALEIYQYQISTFMIESLTTPFPSITLTTIYDYPMALLKDAVFFVKIWIVMSALIFIFLRTMHKKADHMTILTLSAWTIAPWGLIVFLLSPISLLLRLVIPSFFHYFFVFSMLVLGVVMAPASFVRALTTSDRLPTYKVALSYMLSLFVLFIVFTLNHPDILFYIAG